MKKLLLFFVVACFMAACNQSVNPPVVVDPNNKDTTAVEPGNPSSDVQTLEYQLTEFESDRFGIKAYNYNVIFTLPGTDFERTEMDLGGQKAYQYNLKKGTAYFFYIVSKQQRNELPADGTYNIKYYPTDPNNTEGYPPFGSFCRGYNGAADMSEITGGQHAPMGSYRMYHPGTGQYGTDFTDDDFYSYITDGKITIKTNEDATYTWDIEVQYSNFKKEKFTWTGKYN